MPHLPCLRLLLVATLALVVAPRGFPASPPLPVIPAGTFDVATYGAVGDGATDNTTPLQNALNAAHAAGGGTVEIPAAPQPYRSGPLTVYGGTNLRVDAGATLQALPFGTYPNSTTSPAHFITVASGATNVEISGGGTIDGNGADWWTAYRNKAISSRPRLIQVNHADTVLITGVTLLNSPMFHLAFNATNDVTIDGVTITAPADAPNTDAIDPSGQHYLIENCTISVGDDDVAVKAGGTFCGDITVTHCAFGSGHGVSVGGQTNAGLDGMVVDQCTFNGTTTGLRLKADPTQGGPVQNITYSNLTMTNVPYPFVFYSYYAMVGSPGAVSGSSQTTPAKVAAWNATPPQALNSSTIPTWKNLTLSNITATGATGYSVIWGLPLANALIANVTLNNVRVTGGAGLEIYNAQNVRFTGDTAFSVPAGASPVTTYNALALTGEPLGSTVAPGASVVFRAASLGTGGMNGNAPAYRWTFNGQPLADGPQPDGSIVSGSATTTLTLANVQVADAGSYALQASGALDTYDASATSLVAANTAVVATSVPAVLSVGTSPAAGFVNLSVRSAAGAGDQTLIVGFVVSGNGKPVLVRGVGPTLTNYGVPAASVLADPQVAVYQGNTVLASNDDWGTAATAPDIAATGKAVGAFTLPDGSPDAAVLTTLDDGAYTAEVTGKAGATGVALAEIYDAAPLAGARLINVSARTVAGAGDNTLIVGFSIGGFASERVLIRAVGPSLVPYGVSDPLPDPQLTVFQGQTQIGFNDDWGSAASSPDVAAAARQVGAFTLPDGSKDAALLLTLPPDGYTAHVTTAGSSTGVALVEVYEVP